MFGAVMVEVLCKSGEKILSGTEWRTGHQVGLRNLRFSSFCLTLEKTYMDVVAESARLLLNAVTYNVNVHICNSYLQEVLYTIAYRCPHPQPGIGILWNFFPL